MKSITVDTDLKQQFGPSQLKKILLSACDQHFFGVDKFKLISFEQWVAYIFPGFIVHSFINLSNLVYHLVSSITFFIISLDKKKTLQTKTWFIHTWRYFIWEELWWSLWVNARLWSTSWPIIRFLISFTQIKSLLQKERLPLKEINFKKIQIQKSIPSNVMCNQSS